MLNKHKLYRFCRKTHKWLGLLIGIQVLLWILGGLVMSSLPIDKVHGDHLHRSSQQEALSLNDYHFPLHNVLKKLEVLPASIHLIRVQGVPAYQLKGLSANKERRIYSGLTGKPMPLINHDAIAQQAQFLFTGVESIASVKLLEQLPREAGRLKLPVYKVLFSDWIDTTFYMDGYSGELLKVRSSLWRIFDFFWMLHIMDYDERDDFNNPLLITFAATALLFTITGLILLFQVFRKRDFTGFMKSS